MIKSAVLLSAGATIGLLLPDPHHWYTVGVIVGAWGMVLVDYMFSA